MGNGKKKLRASVPKVGGDTLGAAFPGAGRKAVLQAGPRKDDPPEESSKFCADRAMAGVFRVISCCCGILPLQKM